MRMGGLMTGLMAFWTASPIIPFLRFGKAALSIIPWGTYVIRGGCRIGYVRGRGVFIAL